MLTTRGGAGLPSTAPCMHSAMAQALRTCRPVSCATPLICVSLFEVRYSSCSSVQGSRFSMTDILFSISHSFFRWGQPWRPSILSMRCSQGWWGAAFR